LILPINGMEKTATKTGQGGTTEVNCGDLKPQARLMIAVATVTAVTCDDA
jgi:hypothetical protein